MQLEESDLCLAGRGIRKIFISFNLLYVNSNCDIIHITKFIILTILFFFFFYLFIYFLLVGG